MALSKVLPRINSDNVATNSGCSSLTMPSNSRNDLRRKFFRHYVLNNALPDRVTEGDPAAAEAHRRLP